VIDNWEHVIDGAASAADAPVGGGASRVLATSHEPLRLPGELVWRLALLELPATELHTGQERRWAIDR